MLNDQTLNILKFSVCSFNCGSLSLKCYSLSDSWILKNIQELSAVCDKLYPSLKLNVHKVFTWFPEPLRTYVHRV